MRTNPSLGAALTAAALLSSAILLFSGPLSAGGGGAPGPDELRSGRAGMKKILAGLIRQDEYLDEALRALKPGGKNLPVQDIAALGFSLRVIREDLDEAYALLSMEVVEARPDHGVSPYTIAVRAYSRSISAKTARIRRLTAAAAGKDRTTMRDAVASVKRSGRGGKTLPRLLEERRAMLHLAADAARLDRSSARLSAAGKWLYISSN